MEEINLYDLLRFYAKKWLTIAIFVMAGAIAGIVYTFYIQTPEYASKATLLVVGTNRTSANSDSVVLNNYVELFTSRRVLDPVIAEQSYEPGYEALAAGTTAKNAKNTDIINVSIATSDAKESKELLEGAIESFRNESKKLYGDSNVKINVVDAASTPERPMNVRPLQQIGIAMAAAFAAVVIGLFFMYDYQHSQPAKKSTSKAAATKKKTEAKKAKKPSTKARSSASNK